MFAQYAHMLRRLIVATIKEKLEKLTAKSEPFVWSITREHIKDFGLHDIFRNKVEADKYAMSAIEMYWTYLHYGSQNDNSNQIPKP